ncbi:MAG: HAD-IIIA family hydrolase [Malacoplasma sp.]
MTRRTLWLNYLRPNIFIRNLLDLDIHMLKISGIKLIICDLDNTLVPHFSKFPNKYVYDFINRIKQENIDIVIASNNSKKRVLTFVNKLKETIEIDGCIWNSKKPLTYKIKKYIKEHNYSYNDIMIIGDQFIIDVFLANRLKTKSILVLPTIDPNEKASINIFLKILEKYIYNRLQHENILTKYSSGIKIGNEDDYGLL